MAKAKDAGEFDKVIKENKVVLVDFFATWCGPCQMMMPSIEEIEKDYSGDKDVEILTVDIDANPEIAAKFNVMSVPTFVLFQSGEAVDTVVGASPKETLVTKIKALSKN